MILAALIVPPAVIDSPLMLVPLMLPPASIESPLTAALWMFAPAATASARSSPPTVRALPAATSPCDAMAPPALMFAPPVTC